MKTKNTNEFDKFDKVMDGLLAVPYSELQKKLEEEKQNKGKRKRKRVTSTSHVSRVRKKRVG